MKSHVEVELRNQVAEGVDVIAQGRGFEGLAEARDRQIVVVLKAIRDTA